MSPARPSWENVKVFAGVGCLEDMVSPTFKTYATKGELELAKPHKRPQEVTMPDEQGPFFERGWEAASRQGALVEMAPCSVGWLFRMGHGASGA